MSRRTASSLLSTLLGACLACVGGTALAAADATSSAQSAPLSAQWQHQSRTFNYQGFTSHYTCDGLEAKVRQILIYLGARKDAKVRATGCAYGPTSPSPYAWVSMEFDTLATGAAPVAGGATPPAAVAARWQPVELSTNRPSFMGGGECELIEQLKPVLTASFALEDLEYRTRCIPHSVSLGDYSVRGKVLQPSATK
jgi:hypothetical protein